MGNESYPADSVLEGLSEAIGDIGTPPRTTGQAPHVVNIQKLRDWLDRTLKILNGCRVYHHPVDDGALDFSVYAGYAGSPDIYYAGSTNNLLTNNQTNYIYLALATGAAVLTVSTSAYPAWSTPHFRIGRITTAAGSYDIDATDMVDDRDQNLWSSAGGLAVIEAVTTTPHTIVAAESGKTFTNEGAAAQIIHNLPTCAAGLECEFIVSNANGIRAVADTGDTIAVGSLVSIAGGYIESATIGHVVRLKGINATEWVAVAVTGEWTVETS